MELRNSKTLKPVGQLIIYASSEKSRRRIFCTKFSVGLEFFKVYAKTNFELETSFFFCEHFRTVHFHAQPKLLVFKFYL